MTVKLGAASGGPQHGAEAAAPAYSGRRRSQAGYAQFFRRKALFYIHNKNTPLSATNFTGPFLC
jgi:hypothetical protein